MTNRCFDSDESAEAFFKFNEEFGTSDGFIKFESVKVNSFRLKDLSSTPSLVPASRPLWTSGTLSPTF
jgi:hypothetical protein